MDPDETKTRRLSSRKRTATQLFAPRPSAALADSKGLIRSRPKQKTKIPKSSRGDKTNQQDTPTPDSELESLTEKAEGTNQTDEIDFQFGQSDDNDNDELDEDADDDEEGRIPEPKYTQGQKVLARDQDGLLYHAFVRRSLYGAHHHKQVQVGMITSQEEMQAHFGDENRDPPKTWHYFVHFLQWKANWDRWVTEDDVLDLTDKNERLQQRLIKEHRDLQKQFKAAHKTTSGRKIDGGTFLKAWRRTLDRVLEEESPGEANSQAKKQQKKRKIRKQKSNQLSPKALNKEYDMRSQSFLTQRPGNQTTTTSLVLAFGLKRVLVEEWEIMSQFDMVHPLPAAKTVRTMLDDYLLSKGVSVGESTSTAPSLSADSIGSKEGANSMQKSNLEHSPTTAFDGPTTMSFGGTMDGSEGITPRSGNDGAGNEGTSLGMNQTVSANNAGSEEEEEMKRRHKEWRNMANGICLLFDQALEFRLLYPCEQSQLTLLEQTHNLPASEIYGCEHLLRLLVQLPALLEDLYKPKEDADASVSIEYDHEEIVKPILAKMNDLVRFLSKNQDECFPQRYRKKTLDETKVEQRWIKRWERQRAQADVELTM